MILVFTATTRELYKRDILNVCSLPEGAYIKFSYRQEHVAPGLQPQGGKGMEGNEALIIFCEYFQDGNPQLKYHPLRLATIVTVDQNGSGPFTLTLRLQKFFDYSGDAVAIANVLNECQNYVAKSNERPATTPAEGAADSGHVKRYVRQDDAWKADRFTGSWETLVAHVGRLRNLSNSAFFRTVPPKTPQPEVRRPVRRAVQGLFVRALAVNTHGALPPPFWDADSGRGDYRVVGGRSYDLTVRVLFGKDAEHQPPELTVRDDVVTTCGPFLTQNSGGMEARFVVSFKRSFQSELSTLTVRVPPGANNHVRSAELFGVLEIDAPRTWWIAVLLLVSGAFLQSLGPEVKDWAKSAAYSDSGATELSWIVKLVGLALFGIGAYLGFRKLPLKGGG